MEEQPNELALIQLFQVVPLILLKITDRPQWQACFFLDLTFTVKRGALGMEAAVSFCHKK